MNAEENTGKKEVTIDFSKDTFLFKFFGVGFLQRRVGSWPTMSSPPSVNQQITSFLFNEGFLI